MEIDLASVLALVMLLVVGGAALKRLDRIEARTRLTARRVDDVLAALGTDTGEEPHVRAARNLVADGKKLQAVALWREATGDDLVAAKRAVDGLASGA